MKRLLRRIFERAEALFDFAFGQRGNPLVNLGALGWFFFWICAASGIYLYIFFDTGVVDAYASVEYLTHKQWYLGGIMRSLHRYTSDALVVVVLLHLLREFSLDRLRGKRFFAWLTGVPLLAFIYVCGISGYWLVWDKLAQYIAVVTSEWLDTLPFFAEPIANNFLNESALGGRFFTLMVFIHIFAPLFLLLLMWVHIQRHTNARVNPPRPLMIGTSVMLLVLSLLWPARSQGPADLDTVPAVVGLDWFYMPLYPLLDVIPGGILWLLVLAVGLAVAVLPWAPPATSPPAAVVSLDNCNGCTRCVDDCPYSAITMQPRSDGRRYDSEAVVTPELCLSCGLCAGACPTSTPFRRAQAIVPGIELPDRSISSLRERILATSKSLSGGNRVLVFGCEPAKVEGLADETTGVLTMPCVGMLPPSFIDFVLSRQLANGVMIAGCGEGDCYYRFGNDWTAARVTGTRDPYLRKRVPLNQVCLNWLPPRSQTARAAALDRFRSTLEHEGD